MVCSIRQSEARPKKPLWTYPAAEMLDPRTSGISPAYNLERYLLISPGLGQGGARTDWPCKIILMA
jgi:hypothetical protein